MLQQIAHMLADIISHEYLIYHKKYVWTCRMTYGILDLSDSMYRSMSYDFWKTGLVSVALSQKPLTKTDHTGDPEEMSLAHSV